jgi:hypothetical protein
MRKVFLTLIITSLFIAPAAFAIAGSESNNVRLENEVRLENKNETTENRVENREEIKERVASKVAELKQVKKERIRKSFSTIISKTEAAINRLIKLIERLETRIAWIKANDKALNTDVAESDIAKAQAMLISATNDLDKIKADFETMLGSEEPKVGFDKLKQDIKKVKQQLVDTHKLLVHAIGDIKGQRVGETKETNE